MCNIVFQIKGISHFITNELKLMICFEKLGIIQVLLQTLNAKNQNTKIFTTIYVN